MTRNGDGCPAAIPQVRPDRPTGRTDLDVAPGYELVGCTRNRSIISTHLAGSRRWIYLREDACYL